MYVSVCVCSVLTMSANITSIFFFSHVLSTSQHTHIDMDEVVYRPVNDCRPSEYATRSAAAIERVRNPCLLSIVRAMLNETLCQCNTQSSFIGRRQSKRNWLLFTHICSATHSRSFPFRSLFFLVRFFASFLISTNAVLICVRVFSFVANACAWIYRGCVRHTISTD